MTRLSPPADLDDVFKIFETRTNLEKGLPPGNPNRVYRLDRMRVLCRAFGDPQEKIRTIHIAGSKGKGSVAAYMSALLNFSGRRVGVYGSPHLVDYRERFRIEGNVFPEKTALEVGRFLLKKLPEVETDLEGEGGATTFELLTLFAFLLFVECGCDTAVLETGLGGRLDATNIIRHPEAVIFTPVELEHTEVLGKRIPLIAKEKAGILKIGTQAWSARQTSSAMRVFRRSARGLNVPLRDIDTALASISAASADSASASSAASVNPALPAALIKRPSEGKSADLNRYGFTWNLVWKNGKQEKIQLQMGGRIQAENAALALLTARSLEPALLEENSACDVLKDVRLPGRFHWLRESPPVIIDGAHTPKSVAALRDAFLAAVRKPLSDSVKCPSPLLLFGCALGKDAEGMAKELCSDKNPAFHEVIVSTPGTFKPSDPPAVAESFRRTGATVTLIPEPAEAWALAQKRAGKDRPILVTGSFYMAGEIAVLDFQQ